MLANVKSIVPLESVLLIARASERTSERAIGRSIDRPTLYPIYNSSISLLSSVAGPITPAPTVINVPPCIRYPIISISKFNYRYVRCPGRRDEPPRAYISLATAAVVRRLCFSLARFIGSRQFVTVLLIVNGRLIEIRV